MKKLPNTYVIIALLIVLCAVIMLLMFASGICSIVYVCVINNSFKRILKMQ